MNRRAARRQQGAAAAQPKAGRGGSARSILRGPAPSKTAARRPAGPGQGLRGLLYPEWARGIASELRKVTWPTRDETQNLTIVVIVVAIAVGIILGMLDFIFSWLVEQLLF